MAKTKYTAPLPVRVAEPMRDDLRKAAQAREQTVSEYVRAVLAEAMERERKPQPA